MHIFVEPVTIYEMHTHISYIVIKQLSHVTVLVTILLHFCILYAKSQDFIHTVIHRHIES